MAPRFLHESSKLVRLRGQLVRKHEVQLGRLFVEDERKRQTYADPCLYSTITVGTFRRGDIWFCKNSKGGVQALKPNAPFGYPQATSNFLDFDGDERVFVLKVVDRGPV